MLRLDRVKRLSYGASPCCKTHDVFVYSSAGIWCAAIVLGPLLGDVSQVATMPPPSCHSKA
jgi:hypothetical protein